MNSIPMANLPRRGGRCLPCLVGSDLASQILRAGKRILAFHVSDWLVPTTDLVNDRGMPEMVSSIFRQFVGWLKTPDLMALLNWKYSHRIGGSKILTAHWILASIASRIIAKE